MFPRKLRTSPRVPAYLDNRNTALLQTFDLTIHDFDRFFNEVEFIVDSDIIQREFKSIGNGSYYRNDIERGFHLTSARHTTDLIQKYFVKPAPESSKIQKPIIDLEQESEKSALEIRKIKKEQAEKQKMQKYTIKSTDKAALKDSLIENENAIDKGVADTVKNHKRQHDDDDDDDDDEDPSAGPNQGKAPSKSSKTGKSATAKELVEESIVEVVMDDAVNTAGEDVVYDDDKPQYTSEPKTYKTLNQDWLKQPPRPPTLDPELNKRQVVLDQPKKHLDSTNGLYNIGSSHFNDLMATFDLTSSKTNLQSVKGTCTSNIELEYNFQECFNALADKLDWNNPEGDRYPFYLSKPLPLSVSVKKLHGYGHLEEIMMKRTDRQLYKFKEGVFMDLYLNDIEDIASCCSTQAIPSQRKLTLFDFYLWLFFSDGTLKTVCDELHYRILDFSLGYNNEMSTRKWTAIDKKISELTVELIDKQMRERRIIKNLE
ncbi:hypothetical protein Tco_1076556 [Tanacetum coccineum]